MLSDSAISQDGSADSSCDSGTKKRGIVRQMAKEIEKKIRKIIIHSSPVKCKRLSSEDDDAMAEVNKLLMGQVSLQISRKTNVKSKQSPRRINSTPNFSRLLAPIPFRRDPTFQKGVKLNNRRRADATAGKAVTRSQSERTGVKYPRISFRKNKKLSSFSSRNSFSESELADHDISDDSHHGESLKAAKSEPELEICDSHPIQVREMIENIENGKQVQRSRSLTDKPKSQV